MTSTRINRSTEVVKGSTQKAMSGGTPGRAPVGYLNTKKTIDHKQVSTIEIDSERWPLMAWVFEQYASGDWSTRDLLEEATAKGLTSRPGPNSGSKPLSLSNFIRLLKNGYYTGVVTYRKAKYPGNHESLVSEPTFAAVQEKLESRRTNGERKRQHNHYLKGSLICARCGSRMIVSQNKNRHGTIYPCFVCVGRHQKRNNCDLPYSPVDIVEDKVAQVYASRSLSSAERQDLEQFIHDELPMVLASSSQERARQHALVVRLSAQRDKLMEAYYADAITTEHLRAEQAKIAKQLTSAERVLSEAAATQDQIERNVSKALDLAENCYQQYISADPATRREQTAPCLTPSRLAPRRMS